MSTTGQFSSKNPTIKRILKEASELATTPSSDYYAAPLESDLFEWHFTIRGPPPPSPYASGLYHGRIVLPPAYPLKPPSFRFTTPTGRFEVNREICLSISGHHEETWQPAWGIRTALVAIRSFMDTEAKGQLGGMDTAEEVRRRFAIQSANWKCGVCGRTNQEIMREREDEVMAMGGEGNAKKEEVPEELRLGYREDLLGKDAKTADEQKAATSRETQGLASPPDGAAAHPETSRVQGNVIAAAHLPAVPAQGSRPSDAPVVRPGAMQQQQPRRQVRHNDGVPAWIDKAIFGVVAALAALVWVQYLS